MREYQFPVVIEYDPTENAYLAECTMLPGCYTDGETYEEALANIRDAIQLVIESRLAVGNPVPIQDHVTAGITTAHAPQPRPDPRPAKTPRPARR